jgi:hypothetical protein
MHITLLGIVSWMFVISVLGLVGRNVYLHNFKNNKYANFKKRTSQGV